jgi:microcin C transport system ATP-binding protein
MSVAQIISEGLEVHSQLSADECDAEVIRVLKEVGLDPQSRHRYPHDFPASANASPSPGRWC